jgi:catechol 2,3-dioxygenase-like lactoylglutathione lyase family enzyme
VGIVPTNLKRSLDFYKKIGLNVIKEQFEEERYINKLLSTTGIKLKTYKLGVGNKIFLELLEIIDAEITLCENTLLSGGLTHFAIQVKNLDMIYYSFRHEIRFHSNPLTSPDGNVKVVFCKDPDENFIELVEIL